MNDAALLLPFGGCGVGPPRTTGGKIGGAFSGKDPSKVDRSGAYFCRYVARQLVQHDLARRAEVQVAYAIGIAELVSVKVATFGTGDERAAPVDLPRFRRHLG